MRSGFAEELVKIDAEDLIGDWVVGPALFDERDEQGTGFFQCAQTKRSASSGVCVAVYGGVGGNDEHVACARRSAGGGCAGFNDAEYGDGHGGLNSIECEGAGGVAGDDEELGSLFTDQELRAFDGIAGDGAARFGSIWKASSVADESKVRMRQAVDERAEHGKAAEAGIEDADGGCDT